MNIYKPNEFAKMLGVSVRTLQRWDKDEELKAYRNPSNRRYYTHNQYVEYIGKTNQEEDKRKVVIYTRVSSAGQKNDLKNQKAFIKQYANAKGIIVDKILEDIESGLNYNRKKWNKLLEECSSGLVKTIIILHKDRFIPSRRNDTRLNIYNTCV